MVDTGYVTPSGKIIVRGDAPIKIEKNVETAANVYPGRLVKKGTTDHDIAVADGLSAPIGWAGYEDSYSKKDAKTTIYAASDKVAVLRGGGFAILGKLAKGFVAVQGEKMFSWSEGRVAPGKYLNGVPAIKIPFMQNASEKDSNVDLVAAMKVVSGQVDVTTNVGGSTIDVGLLSSESAGDADGFLDGISCAVAGLIEPDRHAATEGAITLGALLKESNIKDAWAQFYAIPKKHTVATAVSVTYTTSAHAVVGNIYIAIDSPGVVEVGEAAYGVSAAAADADIVVESIL